MVRHWFALSLLSAFLISPAEAIEPQTHEAVVLNNKVFDGYTYQDTLVPSAVDTFTLLADVDNAIRYVQTLEYYWPLSRNFYASFDKLNMPLDGMLRVTRAGKVIAEIGRQRFVTVYPNGTTGGRAHMVWGNGAGQALADYRAAMADYNRRLTEARLDRMRYDQELKAAAVAGAKGGPAGKVAPPMPEPEPVRLYVTDPTPGFRVNLPRGQYDIALYEGSLLVEGSPRRLDVIAAESHSAVTLDVIPEERWTRILPSNTVADTIYSAPGKTFYVSLNRSDRFDEKAYQSLVNPQSFGVAGRDIWVRRSSAAGKRLEVRQPDGNWQPVELERYKVRQTGGAQLGYVIEPAAPDETPDLSAYRVTLPPFAGTGRPELRVVDLATGDIDPGTTREIVTVVGGSSALIWGTAAIPLIFGLAIVARRRLRRI